MTKHKHTRAKSKKGKTKSQVMSAGPNPSIIIISSESESSVEVDSSNSQETPIVPAIQTMKFRKKRGNKMKELMKGKIDEDRFWEQHCVYFGGNLNQK
jgi:hypothetical protein